MSLWSSNSRIVVTSSNRIAPWLQKEAQEIGFSPVRVFKTGIELYGNLKDCISLNVNLRCASQVLFSLKEFTALNAEALYRELVQMEWENIIPADGYFSVSSNVSNETITNNLYANVKVKDAIADRFRQRTGSRPDSGSELNAVVIHLYWKESIAEIFLDTSGETLSKHGYRKIPGKAPMIESLAAATILAGNWNGQSSFVNPMCGSGTLAIEAAMIATDRRPGLFRQNYSFMHVCGYQPSYYETALQQIKQKIKTPPLGMKIIASDISADAVAIAQVNAEIAGVKELIQFEQCDFSSTTVPAAPGVIYFNPEYGDRLGEELALQATYKRIGDFLKQNCKGYLGYIFTGNLELAKKIGLKPKRRIEFYSSKIDCRLLEYELYAGSRDKPE